MQTYLQFKTKIKQRAFPGGEPANLVAPHDAMFQNGMLELQKWVPCLKEYNVSTWESADRYWEAARTVVNAPFGQIRRVYAVAGGTDRWHDKVYYRSSNVREIECWSRHLIDARTPTGLPDFGYGFRKEEAASDWQHGRARQGIWAVWRNRLYIAPWLQSYEMLVVEWDGEKEEWQDSDGVDPALWRADAEMAMLLYLKWQHELHYGDPGVLSDKLEKQFDKALAGLMHWCRENTRQRQDEICSSSGGIIDPVPSGGVGDDGGGLDSDDEDPTDDTTDEDEVLFDFVGDVEETTEGEALAAAIETDNPEFLILGGDIGYHNDNGGYEAALSPMYSWAKNAGIIIPAIGNHEYDGDSDLSEYLAFFAEEVGNNGRYYEFTHGSVHGIVENRNTEEEDGYNTTSAQNEYIMAKMLLSTARWKFCFGHQPPYSSDSTYGSNAALQRDYAGVGVHAVFSAHAHVAEHVIVDGVHYFTCGLGGRSRYDFGAAIEGSEFRYNEKETRIRVTLNCDECLVEFVTSDGETVYSYTIEHE